MARAKLSRAFSRVSCPLPSGNSHRPAHPHTSPGHPRGWAHPARGRSRRRRPPSEPLLFFLAVTIFSKRARARRSPPVVVTVRAGTPHPRPGGARRAGTPQSVLARGVPARPVARGVPARDERASTWCAGTPAACWHAVCWHASPHVLARGALARGVEHVGHPAGESAAARAPSVRARSRRPPPAAPASAAARVRALSAQSRTHSPTTYDAMLPSDRRRAPSATRARAECSLASACSACLVPDACARRAHASCSGARSPGLGGHAPLAQ